MNWTFETLFTAGLDGGSGALQGMDGFTMDPGFRPRWAIQYWRGGNQHNAFVEDMAFDIDLGLQFSIDTALHQDPATNAYSVSLSNFDGVNDIRGDDPLRQEGLAPTATDGVQFSIRLADLGLSPFSPIKVAAAVVGGAGFVSNQWLPPLNPTDPVPVLSTDTFIANMGIPDGGIASNTQTPANAGAIGRVTDLKVTVNISHPAVEELNIDLRHDNSDRTVRLWEGSGGGVNMGTTFANGGAALATWVAPGVGEFEVHDPENNSLLTFNDVDPNDGTWTLVIEDTATGNVGTLDSWTIDLREDIGGAVYCLGIHGDPPENLIDLGGPDFPGEQFLDVGLAMAGTPTTFTGRGIPVAFLPQAALATQNNHTCFGDAVESAPANPPGSEMDQLFITNTDDRLKMAITGNLENNHNAFIVLFDTDPAAGLNPIVGITSPPDPLGGGGGPPPEPGLNGMILDSGFAPDYGLVVYRSDPTAPGDDFSVFLTDLNTNFTRAIGRLIRNSGSGELEPAQPNGNGSELDQMFLQNDAANLYIGLTGNLENNGNAFVVFLDTWESGTSNFLDTDYPGSPCELRALAGSLLDFGFNPDYAIVLDRQGGIFSAELADLTDVAAPNVISLTYDTVVAPNTFVGNNTNALGVDDDELAGAAQQMINAATATTGLQFAIDRASIGSPGDLGVIGASAVLVSGGGWWSNQTLPGLGANGQVANLGMGADLSGDGIDQFTNYTMADFANYASPSTFDGTAIPAAMGTASATQDNYTGFGNAALPPNAGNLECMQVAFDDSNVFGVTATSGEGGETAETGMEYDIPFADLGLTPISQGGQGTEIKIMTVLTGRIGYLSNQFLPPLGVGNAPNLGNAGLVDLNTFAAQQFISYILTEGCGSDPADINGDGVVDENDIVALVGALLGTNTDPCPLQKADVNGDLAIDGLDIQAFVTALLTP